MGEKEREKKIPIRKMMASAHLTATLTFSVSLSSFFYFTFTPPTGDSRGRVRGICLWRRGDARLAHGDGKRSLEKEKETQAFVHVHTRDYRSLAGKRRSRPSRWLSLSLSLYLTLFSLLSQSRTNCPTDNRRTPTPSHCASRRPKSPQQLQQ